MATYLSVSDDVAGRVASGALAAGEELPSVREAASHLEVAMAIASGQADAELRVRAAATALDLNFTPVTWENFDIVLSADALGAAEPDTTCQRPLTYSCWIEPLRNAP
jgi:hypothetical protein